MLKIGTQEDCKKLSNLPIQIQVEVESVITRLNFHYGEHRNIDNDKGGYVLIIEDTADYEMVKGIFDKPIYELILERVKKIVTEERSYTSSLIRCNSNCSITLISTIFLTPLSFLDYMESVDNGKSEQLKLKIEKEIEDFRKELLLLPKETIIEKAYEITAKEDIYTILDYSTFKDGELTKLSECPHIINTIYDRWLKNDISIMNDLTDEIMSYLKEK